MKIPGWIDQVHIWHPTFHNVNLVNLSRDLRHRQESISLCSCSIIPKNDDLLNCIILTNWHFFPFFYRNMAREHDEIVSCLRRKSLDELTKFTFDTPSFLTAMGPSRDGVLIPADFGLDATIRKSRAHSTSYQVKLVKKWVANLTYPCIKLLLFPGKTRVIQIV